MRRTTSKTTIWRCDEMPFVREIRVGDEYARGGCLWRAVRLEPYTRKDGSETELATWRGACAVCGGPKFVKTPATCNLDGSSSFGLRRCPDCIALRRNLPTPPVFGVWQRRVLEAIEDLKLTADEASEAEVVMGAVRRAPPPRGRHRDLREQQARRALALLVNRPDAGISRAGGGISWG